MITNDLYVYDIETTLAAMEDIVNKYQALPVDAVYLKGSRFPITDRCNLDRYIQMKMVSDKPFHPLVSASILRDIIYMLASDHNPHRNMLKYNQVLHIVSPVYCITGDSIEDILFDYLPMLTKGDLLTMLALIATATEPILKEIETRPEFIYGVCIETQYFKLMRHEDIRAYRYQEALDHMEHDNE